MTFVDTPAPPTQRGPKGTVFWKVAGLLIGVQVVIGMLAVGLSALFAYEASLDLVSNSLRLRLDGLAEEVELRAPMSDDGLHEIPQVLVSDIATRFPDPITLVGRSGQILVRITPDTDLFPEFTAEPLVVPSARVAEGLASGDVIIDLGKTTSIGIAPLYDAAGFLAGGVVVYPLTNSVVRELAGTRSAFFRALAAITILAGVFALVVGGVLTWRMVRPLRSITAQVERIGKGEYASRLPVSRDDEFGRLSESINTMATKVEQAFETLVSSDRLRRDLVANIGHDLRTPLTAMRGYIDEANRALSEKQYDLAREMLSTASQQTMYISALISDLFEMALLDSPAPPLHLEPVPIGELIAQAAAGQRGLFRASNSTLRIQAAEGLPTIRADGVRLLRVLNNLLDNARKYGRPGGIVSVEASVAGDRIAIAILDDGPGIDAASLETLFERYYRGEGPRTRTGGSTGLGLAISRAIAQAHGGTLTASSAPGKGSQFVLTLPVS